MVEPTNNQNDNSCLRHQPADQQRAQLHKSMYKHYFSGAYKTQKEMDDREKNNNNNSENDNSSNNSRRYSPSNDEDLRERIIEEWQSFSTGD